MLESLPSTASVVYGLLMTASGHGGLQSYMSEHTQARICSGCVPREQIITPGIGIDLTTTYYNHIRGCFDVKTPPSARH